MKFKKIITILLASTVVMSLAGCGKKEDTSNKNSSKDGLNKKMTVSVASFELNTKGTDGKTDPIYAIMAKKFNVKITPVTITWDTWDQQVNTMLASGDLPDILRYNMGADKYSQYTSLAEQGVIRQIPDLSKYPNLAKLEKTMPIVNKLKVDGKLYAWPSARQDNPYNTNNSIGIIYRRDWAKKLGLYKPNDEYTLDEFTQMAQAFKDKNPGNNSAGKTIPFAEVGWGFGFLMQAFNPYNTYTKIDGKYVWSQTLPGAVEGLKFYSDLYKNGLYYKDFYAAKDYDARSLYYANRVGIYVDNLSLNGYNNDLKVPFKKANPKTNVDDAMAIMYVKGSDGKFFTSQMENSWSAAMFNPKIDDAKMDRILKMLDWSLGKEGSDIFEYGVEGKDWAKDGSNIEVKWPKDKNGNYVAPTYNFTQFRDIAALSGDFGMTNPNISDQTKKDEQTFQQKYTADNANIIKLDYDVDYLSGTYKNKYGTFSTDTSAEQKKLVVASKNIESDYKAWINTMLPKVNKVLDEINKGLK